MALTLGPTATLDVEVYDGPLGQGYVLISEIEVFGTTYHRSENVGPDSNRSHDWQPIPGPLVGLTLGTPAASCTFNSITVELPYAGAFGRAELRYRKTGTLAWRTAAPLWPCAPAGQQAYAIGSVSNEDASVEVLDHGTTYDLRLDVYDATGGHERLTLQATTRIDNIETHASLLARATHFITVDGSDTNDGLSVATAWKTINKARLLAPFGAVVVVGSLTPTADEHYPGTGSASLKLTPLTLVARHPACDEQGQPTNAGKRAIIDGKLQSGPLGAATEGVVEAPWVEVGNGVWRWAGAWTAVGSAFGAQSGNAAWSAARDGTYRRLWYWDNGHAASSTPTAWMSLLLENVTFRYGYWKDPGSDDLYVRMADDLDPNTVWISFGHGSAFGFGAPDARVCGFVFRGWFRGINGNMLVDRMVIDRNQFECVTFPLLPTSPNGTAGAPADVVVEHNSIKDTGLSTVAPDSEVSAPWSWVKKGVKLPGSEVWIEHKFGGKCEGMAIRYDGARRLVARHNTVVGAFNGISVDNPSNRTRHSGSEWDVHDNRVVAVADDSLEPPTAGNWRVWNHRAEQCLTLISSGPSAWGPCHFTNVTAWRCGTSAYIAPWADGRTDPLTASIAIKHSSASSPQTRWYWRHVTFWSDLPGSNYGDPTASGSGGLPEWIDLADCIVRVGDGGDVLNVVQDQYTADRNQYAAPASAIRGFRVVTPTGAVRCFTFADYRRLCPSQDASSNTAIPDHTDVALVDAQFVDAPNGDLRPVAASLLAGLGAISTW